MQSSLNWQKTAVLVALVGAIAGLGTSSLAQEQMGEDPMTADLGSPPPETDLEPEPDLMLGEDPMAAEPMAPPPEPAPEPMFEPAPAAEADTTAQPETTIEKEGETDEPEREGFTLHVSTGLGISSILYSQGDTSSYAGFGANVGLGGFLTPHIALLLRGSFILFGPFTQIFDNGFTLAVGPMVQFWPVDWFFAGIGAGFGLNMLKFASGCYTCTTTNWEGSASITGELGFSVYSGPHSAISLFAAMSLVPSPQDPMLGTQLGIGWHYY